MELMHFFLRWIHFLAGITWIGILYYFNFVQTPFFAETEAPVRVGAIQKLVPRALWWFRWGAMFTFLAGILMYLMRLGANGRGSIFRIAIWRGDYSRRFDGHDHVFERLAGDLAQPANRHGLDQSSCRRWPGVAECGWRRAPGGA